MLKKQFPSLIQGLRIFNGIYGHTHIPVKYIIPNKNDHPTWPVEMMHFPLGKYVASARSLKKKHLLSDNQIEALNHAGIVWDPRVENFKVVLETLKTFKSIHGHLQIPLKTRFIVPAHAPWPMPMWNKALNPRVLSLRKGKDLLSALEVELLTNIGFKFNVVEAEWDEKQVYSLRKYKDIHGDLLIPIKFIVPKSERWPEHLHGYRLGQFVSRLRIKRNGLKASQIELLNELGMIWNIDDHKFEATILPALRVYYAKYGELSFMSQTFSVPVDDTDFPESAHGMHLGECFWNMKRPKKKYYYNQVQKHLEELEQMGFQYSNEIVTLTRIEEQAIIRGLAIYRALFGHTVVPRIFDPRNVKDWPREDIAIPLGKLHEKARKLYKEKQLSNDSVDLLSAHGIFWETSVLKSKVLPALRKYSELYGHINTPFSFIVPHDDFWPKQTWGMALGKQVSRIRNKKNIVLKQDDIASLNELGFEWAKPVIKRWDSFVFPALKKYVQLYGTANISTTFKIPSTGSWTREYHGFTLGQTLYAIKRGISFQTIPEKDREELKQLGYDL